MERTVGYFDRFELFQPKNGNAERAAAASTTSVGAQVDAWYDGFWDISMKYCEGNIQAAEYLMDTSVFMFYYRIKQKAHYAQWHNEQQQRRSSAG
jgi:hypothetical protein